MIQAKKRLLANENVQLVKLRNNVIVQSSDHEDWENEEFMMLEEGAKLIGEHINRTVKRKDSEEEDLRPYEMAIITTGKNALSTKLKKARMPGEVKSLYVLGMIRLTIGGLFFTISLILIIAELIYYFQRGSTLKTAIDNYGSGVRQSEYSYYLVSKLLHIAKHPLLIEPNVEKKDIEDILDNFQALKNSLGQSQSYLDVMSSTTLLQSLGIADSRRYRISEVLEQVVGKVIRLKDQLKTGDLQTLFSMTSDDFFFVVMNTMNTLHPYMKTLRSRLYGELTGLAVYDLSNLSIVLALLSFVVISIVALLILLKKSLDLRLFFMNPFVHIPENTIKLCHAQCEYFVLLFNGMEDKHLDDIKAEVSSLRKISDQANVANTLNYGKKKKRFTQRSMMHAKIYFYTASLILGVLLYSGLLLYLGYFEASAFSLTIPFAHLQKQRTIGYYSSLAAISLANINPNMAMTGDMKSSQLTKMYAEQAYTFDSEFFEVNSDSLAIFHPQN